MEPVHGRSVDESADRTAPVVNPRFSYRRLRVIATALAIIAVMVLFGVQVAKVLAPPRLTVTSPAADIVVTEPQVTLSGKTDPEVTVQVNDRTIAVDASGKFQESIDLQPGLNTLLITAAKKSSRKATITRRVLVQLSTVVQ